MNKITTLLFIFLPQIYSAFSQEQPDSSKVRIHSPKLATVLSALIPGSGQIYNRQYWKAPVIYAGFAGLFYVFNYNNKLYKEFKTAYIFRTDSDLTTLDMYENTYSDESLITIKDYYKRNRDLSLIGMGLLYIINVLDATVYAHLFKFNVSPGLSMEIHPDIGMMSMGRMGIDPRLSMKLSF